MELFTKWINMLRGKPVSSGSSKDEQKTSDTPKTDQQTSPQETQQTSSDTKDFYFAEDGTSEDSVAQDLKAAENIAKSVVDKVKSAPVPKPQVSKNQANQSNQKTSQKPSSKLSKSVMSKISNKFLGKILRVIVIVVLFLILIFVLLSLFRLLNTNETVQNGGDNTTQTEVSPSPTPVTYRPYEPSIYADDPEILQIEEDVSVLDAELYRANLGDPVTRPPNLDFNISF